MGKARIIQRILFAQGGFLIEDRLRLPKGGTQLQFLIRNGNVIMQKKSRPRKSPTQKQKWQRMLYCDCDRLYRLLKEHFSFQLYNWYYSLPNSVKKGLTLNNVFMKYCLKFNISDLLRYWFGLEILPLTIEEHRFYVKIYTKIRQLSLEDFMENFFEPIRFRY